LDARSRTEARRLLGAAATHLSDSSIDAILCRGRNFADFIVAAYMDRTSQSTEAAAPSQPPSEDVWATVPKKHRADLEDQAETLVQTGVPWNTAVRMAINNFVGERSDDDTEMAA
jgi:hypothetical protein